MVQDVDVTVTTDKAKYNIVITGKQLTETVMRRMRTLAPKERVIDLTQNHGDSQQLDSTRKPRS